MHVALTEEQELLRATAIQLAEKASPASADELGGAADDATVWRLLADAGLLGLRAPESAGGGAGSGVEVAVVAEALGRALVASPYLGSGVLATELLAAAGADEVLLASLAVGDRRLAVGLTPSLDRLACLGEPAVAWDAHRAQAALVLDEDRHLISVAMAEDSLPGTDLTRSLRRVADATVDVGDLGRPIEGDGLARWEALALASLCADVVGVMDGALATAVEYVKERVQFGVPVGSFQAVQHLAADQLVTVEAARSATAYAAWAVDRLPVADALLAARTAKAYCSEAARPVTEAVIQLHGGIGMTWEHRCHLFLRRALLDRATLGDEHHQLEAIAAARLGGQG